MIVMDASSLSVLDVNERGCCSKSIIPSREGFKVFVECMDMIHQKSDAGSFKLKEDNPS